MTQYRAALIKDIAKAIANADKEEVVVSVTVVNSSDPHSTPKVHTDFIVTDTTRARAALAAIEAKWETNPFINASYDDVESLRGITNSQGDKPFLLQIYDNLHAWETKAKDLEKSVENFRKELDDCRQPKVAVDEDELINSFLEAAGKWRTERDIVHNNPPMHGGEILSGIRGVIGLIRATPTEAVVDAKYTAAFETLKVLMAAPNYYTVGQFKVMMRIAARGETPEDWKEFSRMNSLSDEEIDNLLSRLRTTPKADAPCREDGESSDSAAQRATSAANSIPVVTIYHRDGCGFGDCDCPRTTTIVNNGVEQ